MRPMVWSALFVLTMTGCKTEAPAPTPGSAATRIQPVTAASICEGGTRLDRVPVGPLRGEASGKPFQPRSIIFEPGEKAWRLLIAEATVGASAAGPPAGQHIAIDLPGPPAAGKRWARPMKYGDGYFQIKKPEDPARTTSWNAMNAWAIELRKWEARPYDDKGPAVQPAGKASGQIVLCYRGGGSFSDSWVAGSFEDALVRYVGKPYWLAGKP